MPDVAENTRSRILGGLALVTSLIGGAIAWSSVNTAIYDDTFHAPVSEVIPMWCLSSLTIVCGALGFSTTPFAIMTGALAYFQLPGWLASAYEADNDETLTQGEVWGTWPQSQAADDATDEGSFGSFTAAYAIMGLSVFLLVLAFCKTPEGTHLSCGSFFERVAIYVSIAAYGALMISGLELISDDPTLTDDDTDPTVDTVGTAGTMCALGFLFIVACLYRNSSGGWLALYVGNACFNMGLFGFQSATMGGVIEQYGDFFNCGDSNEGDQCTAWTNQEEGYALLASALAASVLGVAAHCFFVRGGLKMRDRSCIRFVASLACVLFPLLGFVGLSEIDDDDADVLKLQIEYMAGISLFAWLLLVLGQVFHGDGLGSGFHAASVGFNFFSAFLAAVLMSEVCAATDDGCVPGETDPPMGPLAVWMGTIAMTVVLPSSTYDIICGLLKNPIGLLACFGLGVGAIQFIPMIEYSWSEDGNMADSQDPLAYLAWNAMLGALFIGATNPESSRPLRSFTVFFLVIIGLAQLQSLDYWFNVSSMGDGEGADAGDDIFAADDDDSALPDSDLSAEEKDYISGLFFSNCAIVIALLSLAKTGDWEKADASSASDAGGIETTPRV